MPTEIRVPQLGESVVDAVVGTWLKTEGEPVAIGDTLVELETDKVNVEIAAEQAGVLQQILKPEGETVAVGDVIGSIDEAAVASGTPPAEAAEPAPVAAAVTTPGAPAEEAATPTTNGTRANPSVRRLAAEHDLDINQIPASGEGGRVTREDVMRFIQTQPAPAAQPRPAPSPAPATNGTAPAAPEPAEELLFPPAEDHREERVRLSRRRQTIAQRLVEAQQTAAMLTTFNEVDMSAVMDLRKRRRDEFEKRHDGTRLGYMSF